jgi:hypothetical protein
VILGVFGIIAIPLLAACSALREALIPSEAGNTMFPIRLLVVVIWGELLLGFASPMYYSIPFLR